MKEFDLYVVRHGQTYYNIYRKMQGWSNTPLTKQGIDDAQKIADKLSGEKFDAIYCSDMERARYTAKTICDNNLYHSNTDTIVDTPLLRGVFYGSFEGSNIDTTNYTLAASNKFDSYSNMVKQLGSDGIKDAFHEMDPFHQAENSKDYWKRWNKGLQEIIDDPNIQNNGKVLLVSHGPAVLSLVDRFANGKFDVSKRPENGSLTKLHFTSDGHFEVTGYNIK